MRQLAYCLFFAAAMVGLSTCGFLEPSGQVFADDLPKTVPPPPAPAKIEDKPADKKAEKVPAKPAEKPAVKKAKAAPAKAVRVVNDDAAVQQFEMQYGPQLKQMYKSELHFMRTVSQPTKQQFEQISK